ncbi:MAG: molybdopterin-dependent oxidoreductase [Rhodobacteraceae bacterium]|nr:molybdopterin-dependent oxidoreductase [Paracoccaceae bacterium]
MTHPHAFWSRRRFLASSAAFGIALTVRPLTLSAAPLPNIDVMPTVPGWAGDGAGPPRYRIDGFAKVTGAKLYARDFRAADMSGWPKDTSHALLVLARSATRRFRGLDLSSLGASAAPDRVVSAEDLTADKIAATGFFASDLFCPKDSTPTFLGQPLALLIYHDVSAFTQARALLVASDALATYGEENGPVEGAPYGANRFTRIGGDSPRGPDVYSPVKDGWIGPVRYQKARAPVWADPDEAGTAAQRASFEGEQIRADLKAGTSGRVFTQSFQTQSIDQVFMEPESGLGWFDSGSKKLEMLLGVQSPEATMDALGGMLQTAADARKPASIDASFAFLGGGFGGKDHTIFPLYVAVAALYAEGKPVRVALNRFEQFQLGLKRHSATIEQQLGVDPDSGAFLSFACDLSFDGGGLANFSASVADVGATAASSIYYLPKSDITTVATHSRGVTAGSMRGYGTAQTMTAMECLVDEVATELDMDPVALRRKNALGTGELNLTGNTAAGAVRTGEILDALEKSELWAKRADRKRAFEAANAGKAYGTGLACVMKDFGAGGDGVLAAVSLDPDGTITAWSNSIEMGTGISTSVAQRVAEGMGRAADTVQLDAPTLWAPLSLKTSGSPWTITQADQDAAAKDPQWVPLISSPASASIGAHVNTHAVAEASAIILRFGLWPAAQAIWSEGPLGGQAAGEFVRFEDLRWVDGALGGAGLQPLPLATLAQRAHEMGLVTGAMVHAFNRWSWAKAQFNIGEASYEAPIDALAVQRGSADWARLDRTSVTYPPASFERIGVNYYSSCGAVVAVSVDKTNGAVTVEAVHQVLECGRPIVDALVSGIGQGGIAMGIGQALHEYLPLYEDGPGNGTWNLNRYRVPMVGDVPIWNTTMDVLPPLSGTDPPKGMAEVVMIPVIPAVLNGLHDAIGKRFRSLPVTASDIMEAL